MRGIYGNQLKLLEKIENVQERLDSVQAAITELSDNFQRWRSKTDGLDVNLPIS
jgi:hypothetical protein